MVLHPDPVTEQGAARERRRRVDGEHADPFPDRAVRRPSAYVVVDLPTPGAPVRPTTTAFPAVRHQRGHRLAQLGRRVLDQRDQPRDRTGVALRARSTSVGDSRALQPIFRPASRRGPGTDQCVALPAAAAQRGGTGAAAATAQLEREVEHEARAGHADRVTHARSRRR